MNDLFFLIRDLLVESLSLAEYTSINPTSRGVEWIKYQQEGHYFYTATEAPNPGLLPMCGEEVVSLEQTCFLNVGFSYSLQGVQLQHVSGNYEMTLSVMSEQDDWHQSMLISPCNTFSSDAWFNVYTFDLRRVQELVEAHESVTGSHGAAYRIEFVTRVHFSALVMGLYVMGDFEPALIFQYDHIHLLPLEIDRRRSPIHFKKPGSLIIPTWCSLPPVQPKPNQ